jgi:hypothetical protein
MGHALKNNPVQHSVNKTTGESPYKVLMGLNPRPIADAKILATISDTLAREDLTSLRARVATKITHSQSTAEKLFDSHRKPSRSFNPNALVMVRKTTFAATGKPKKLLPKFKGPYRIVAVLPNDRYVVEDLRGCKQSKTVVAADALKPWIVLHDPE